MTYGCDNSPESWYKILKYTKVGTQRGGSFNCRYPTTTIIFSRRKKLCMNKDANVLKNNN